MSPNVSDTGFFPPSFPRVSGDEPLGDITRVDWTTFSPRERG